MEIIVHLDAPRTTNRIYITDYLPEQAKSYKITTTTIQCGMVITAQLIKDGWPQEVLTQQEWIEEDPITPLMLARRGLENMGATLPPAWNPVLHQVTYGKAQAIPWVPKCNTRDDEELIRGMENITEAISIQQQAISKVQSNVQTVAKIVSEQQLQFGRLAADTVKYVDETWKVGYHALNDYFVFYHNNAQYSAQNNVVSQVGIIWPDRPTGAENIHRAKVASAELLVRLKTQMLMGGLSLSPEDDIAA